MTDEKKKPEDEVSEEELKDVAGGTWPKAAFEAKCVDSAMSSLLGPPATTPSGDTSTAKPKEESEATGGD